MSFEKYYREQALSQIGGSFYTGSINYQRGYGIGAILSRIGRYVVPIAKKAMKIVGKQALRSGKDFIADVISGDDPKVAAKRNLKRGAKTLLRRGDKRRRLGGKRGISKKRVGKDVFGEYVRV